MDVEQAKKEYKAPKLERYGTLRELTKAGRTNPGDDFILYNDGTRGSVHPAGR